MPPDPRTVLSRVVLDPDPAHRPLVVDGSGEVLDRRRLRVPAGTTASLATWSSAFPAGWWAAHTPLTSVRLEVEASGPATVTCWRTDAAGRVSRAAGPELPLGGPDGGWLWCDVTAGDADVVVERVDWTGPAVEPGGLLIGVTTFDRPASVLALLEALADPALLDVVDEVLVVDQGARRLRDQPGLTAVEAALGGRLRVVEQPNLGGSGGFARCGLEALAGGSRWLLLLDDDVAVEPEWLRRAVAFADRCPRPVLVAGAMLDLERPTVLHATAERVDPSRFLWEHVPPGRLDHDLATGGLRDEPWLSRRLEPGFGAFWCCLLPVEALRRVGLPLPLFLKWDDVELGLRAGAAGVPTVALPGVGVWHAPWTGKSDTADWQAYFHHRNRLVAALRHSDRRRPWRLLAEGVEHSWRALGTGRPSVAALRERAVDDLRRGPADLPASLGTRRAEVVALQAAGSDAPRERPYASPPMRQAPLRRLAALARLAADVRRDPAALRALVQHAALLRDWPALRAPWRAADLTSPELWRTLLDPRGAEVQ